MLREPKEDRKGQKRKKLIGKGAYRVRGIGEKRGIGG